MEGQMGARVIATKHWSKGDQISSLIGRQSFILSVLKAYLSKNATITN